MTCKGRVHTDLNHSALLNEPSEHNHAPSIVNSEVWIFQEKIRSRAINTTDSTQKVIDRWTKLSTVEEIPGLQHAIEDFTTQSSFYLVETTGIRCS